jgi:hypothetical protein
MHFRISIVISENRGIKPENIYLLTTPTAI